MFVEKKSKKKKKHLLVLLTLSPNQEIKAQN
jgi:hypothetical protein